MKRFLLLIFVISFTNLFATTYTSITNGDWLTYSTWSPAGIPQAGDDVIINHTVTIANDWQCTATITINQGGVLQEDQSGRTFLIQSGGNLINNGTINSTFDATNAGYWYNANNATIDLNHNFTNGDTSNTYHTAVFVNNGNFNIGDSWHNADTTKGASTGSFIVQNGSYNTGVMIGSFDFCDQTPITTTAPFIDYNTGTIDTNITYCSVGIKNNKITDKIKIYPVPSPDFINIESNIKLNNTLKVYNILGSVVTSLNINKQNNNLYKIDIRNLKSEIYFIKINNQSKKIIQY